MTATGSSEVGSRNVVLLVAAGALAVVVVVVVLLFGVARPPNLVTLAAEPDPAPPASIAWLDHADDVPCLYRVAPDGTRSEVACGHDVGEPIAWDDGIVVRAWGTQEEHRTLDPDTGAELRHEPVGEAFEPGTSREAEVVSRTRGGTLTVTTRAEGQVVWRADVHENYHIRMGVRSPDGDWVALLDSADRLLIVPADGSTDPRVWIDDVTTWDRLIWEGTTLVPEGR